MNARFEKNHLEMSTDICGDVDGLSLLFVFRARHATRNGHRVGANVISGDVMNETDVRVETNAERPTSDEEEYARLVDISYRIS